MGEGGEDFIGNSFNKNKIFKDEINKRKDLYNENCRILKKLKEIIGNIKICYIKEYVELMYWNVVLFNII